MAKYEYTPNPDIPYGYCQCGCGQKTKLAKQTSKSLGAVKGQPRFFLKGHHINRTETEQIENFWRRIDQSAGSDACWNWTGGKNFDGYGQLTWKGAGTRAHRLAWILTYGDIPDGMEVCHNCPAGDNPACCNPKHLWLGAHIDNVRDMVAKGRMYDRSGENNPRAKLTWEQVNAIRELYASGKATKYALARQFGVSQFVIYSIILRNNWK